MPCKLQPPECWDLSPESWVLRRLNIRLLPLPQVLLLATYSQLPHPPAFRSWSDIAKLTDSQQSGVCRTTPAPHQRNWSVVGQMLRARTAFPFSFWPLHLAAISSNKRRVGWMDHAHNSHACHSFSASAGLKFEAHWDKSYSSYIIDYHYCYSCGKKKLLQSFHSNHGQLKQVITIQTPPFNWIEQLVIYVDLILSKFCSVKGAGGHPGQGAVEAGCCGSA